MSEVRKCFDLELDDVISFYVDNDEMEFPLTFTIEECIEEYCDIHGLDLVRIVEKDNIVTRIRSGVFFYERHEEPNSSSMTMMGVAGAIQRMWGCIRFGIQS